MRIANVLGLASIAAASSLGCNNFQCPSPGLVTAAGSATYVGSVGMTPGPAVDGGSSSAAAGPGAFGSFSATVALVAFEPTTTNTFNDSQDETTTYCGPSTFTIAILGICSLTADATTILYGASSDPAGAFVSAGATVRSGQTCEVPVTGGTMTLTIQSGSLSLTPGELQLSLAGSTNGAADGYVTLQFDGK